MIRAYAAKTAGAKLELFEYDPGVLKDEEVEIAVEYCGICHSDLSMLKNEWGISQYPWFRGMKWSAPLPPWAIASPP